MSPQEIQVELQSIIDSLTVLNDERLDGAIARLHEIKNHIAPRPSIAGNPGGNNAFTKKMEF